MKNYIKHINNVFKSSTEKLREEIIQKVSAITYQITSINFPKVESPNDLSLGGQTENSTLKELIKPFVMPQSEF